MRLISFIKSFQREIFSPWVALPAVYLLFIALAALSYEIPSTARFLLAPRGFFQSSPSSMSYLITFLGILLLIYAALIGRRIRIMTKKPILVAIFLLLILTLRLAFPMSFMLIIPASLGYAALLWYISKNLDNLSLLTPAALLLAVLFSLTILLKGIPILESSFRQSTAVTPSRALFHGFATVAAALSIVVYPRKLALPAIFFLAVLGVLSGFKSDAVAVLTSAVLAGLLVKKILLKETLLAALSVLLILTFLSNFIAATAYGTWQISPLLYMFYRAGFTFGVFSNIVDMSMPFGYLKGNALFSVSQEIVSMEVLDYSTPHIITSTLLGPGMLDFGLLGIALTAVLLGLYLGATYRAAKSKTQLALYAVALTHSFILVEVGLQLTSFIFFLSLLYLFIGTGEKEAE
ncbi:MAG: hypothetical protein QF829_02795 [Candidatus Hydrothermarchaeota archaeon]|nr:hypothetical protein [Candidatus Hydrothermarchaeota archaeon]